MASASVTGERLSTTPLTITSPVTSSACGLPRSDWMNRARPIVPAAPGTFSTCTLAPGSISRRTRCITRAVWSHPPPGAAGATIVSVGPAMAIDGTSVPMTSIKRCSTRRRSLRQDCTRASPSPRLPPSQMLGRAAVALAEAGRRGRLWHPGTHPLALLALLAPLAPMIHHALSPLRRLHRHALRGQPARRLSRCVAACLLDRCRRWRAR